MLGCVVDRCGLDMVFPQLRPLPSWKRVVAHAWGPLAAWLRVVHELGLRRVAGSGAVWCLDKGSTRHPRLPDSEGYAVDLAASHEARARAIRNAWRKAQWDAWKPKRLCH
eukprot:12087152-Alexandrium_andersonii.AAC.1